MRGKIWSSALLLSLIVSSLMSFAVVPAFAPTSPSIRAPTIVNPLLGPGETFFIDILVDDVTDLWRFDFTLSYDTNILTASDVLFNPIDPINGYGFRELENKVVDDSAGYVTLAANRGQSRAWILGEYLGTSDGTSGSRVFYAKNPRFGDVGSAAGWGIPDGVINKYDIKVYEDGVQKSYASIRDLRDSDGRLRFQTALPPPPAGTVITADYFHPGLTTSELVPIATVRFTVDIRGETALSFTSAAFYDLTNTPIPGVVAVDGLFNNKFQGKMMPSIIVDDTLMPGSSFPVDIYVDDCKKLWGFQLILSYDPNVLGYDEIKGYEFYDVFGPPYGYGAVVDDGSGNMIVMANAPMGSDIGLTTTEPVAVVRIWFTVINEGWSALDIHDEEIANVYGSVQIFEIVDGGISTEAIAVDMVGRAAWPEVFKFVVSKEEDQYDTLYAKVQCNNTVPMMAQVLFSVYDREYGILLGVIDTGMYMLDPVSTTILAVEFDTTSTAWGTPRYKVSILAQAWIDITGDGVGDFSGSLGRIKPVNIQVVP